MYCCVFICTTNFCSPIGRCFLIRAPSRHAPCVRPRPYLLARYGLIIIPAFSCVHHPCLQGRASSLPAAACIIPACSSVHHSCMQRRASSLPAAACIIPACKGVHHACLQRGASSLPAVACIIPACSGVHHPCLQRRASSLPAVACIIPAVACIIRLRAVCVHHDCVQERVSSDYVQFACIMTACRSVHHQTTCSLRAS